jgi:RNA polymerase sigma-70 factor (ECF subfamily)
VSGDVSDPSIEGLIEACAAARPAFPLTQALRTFFVERAAAILAASDPAKRAADVYLAGACALGEPAAIADVDANLAAMVRPILVRLGAPGDDDEMLQRTRVALLAPGANGTIGIGRYSGRGDLQAYIRAVTAKLALKRRERETGPPADDDPLDFLPDARDSPAVTNVKQRCRDEVRAAFAVALAELEPRERTILRQHYVDGLSIDALAPLHDVHRATCARRIADARAKILRGMRAHFREALDLAPADLDSAIDLVGSQLDLSLSRQLGE